MSAAGVCPDCGHDIYDHDIDYGDGSVGLSGYVACLAPVALGEDVCDCQGRKLAVRLAEVVSQ